MIEADFSLPNIRHLKVVPLFKYAYHIHYLFLVEGALAKDISERSGLSEATLLKLSNHAAMVIKRSGEAPLSNKKGDVS